jgi:large subunit ribosomal protein L3
MSTGIIGRKIGMTGVFLPDGSYIPVTVIQAGPCVITQIKTAATDGYDAIQLGFSHKKKSSLNKPQLGHLKKSGDSESSYLREFRVNQTDSFTLGQAVTTDIFKIGEKIHVTGMTKGRGFSGVIKRHGFHGGKETHGNMSHRVPGSIGSSAWPSKVIKGRKLPGRYGNERRTIRNMVIVDIRPEENILLVKGGIPGARTGMVIVRKS